VKTNHLMLKELLEQYHPKGRGLLLNEEYNLIGEVLHLSEMDTLALRNLRDFVVVSMSRLASHEDWDRMSAITFRIDCEIVEKGGEV